MKTRDTLHIAFKDLFTNRGRSFLTILGIVIGIASIIIVMSIGDSARTLIVKEIQSFGAQNVFINPGNPNGPFDVAGAVLSKSITEKDVKDLTNKSNVPDAVLVNPSVTAFYSVSYGSEIKQATIWGTGADGFAIYNLNLQAGRLFTSEEVIAKANVAVIGKNIAKDVFGLQSPIGEKIKIKDQKFEVIGIFSSENSSMFGIDDMVVSPYTTIQQKLMGIRHFHEIVVQASSPDVVPGMVVDIETVLRNSHNIDDPSKDDFIISTQEDIMKTVNQILNALTIFLALVAAISLLVGGVGVMNIMFVSVVERTQEIGLRKALGATHKDILRQFLFNAVLLTGAGGIIGIITGSLFTFLISVIASYTTNLNFPFIFSLQGALLGIFVAGGTGIIFGIFPARQASQKSPIEALRYE
jgi:putative ABC transport system permease protein